ncbi:MAG: ATPase, partial [Saprospiraceae bacterium]|nr:ATPase [Saprospiraceae bacterium]
SGSMSTAEAISVVNSGLALAAHFGDGRLNAQDLAAGIVGAVVKDPVQDKVVWNEYLETVVKTREDWRDVYRACKEINV